MDGRIAEDFYYTLDVKGKKNYYSRRDGKRTAKARIPASVLDDIRIRPRVLEKSDLLKQRDELTKKYNLIKEQIDQINSQLNGTVSEDELRAEAEAEDKRDRECKQRRVNDQDDREKFLRNLFANLKNAPKSAGASKSTEPPKSTPAEKPELILLKQYKITTRKEWRDWIFENHPDRGGKDLDLCQRIISAGNTIFGK
jgi:hypothetical protein